MGHSHHVLDITLDGEVDFGFAGKIKNHSRLINLLIHRERLLIVCSVDHYLAAKQSITIDELVKVPFIWREKGTQTREVVKKWFEKNVGRKPKGYDLEKVIEQEKFRRACLRQNRQSWHPLALFVALSDPLL
jgi:DNA-binding transcriptional LysR family regulator